VDIFSDTLRTVMLRFGYELRGTVLADMPGSSQTLDRDKVTAVQFWHEECDTIIEVTHTNMLGKLRHSQHDDPCGLCDHLPGLLPKHLDSYTLVPCITSYPCERCTQSPSFWLYLPMNPPNPEVVSDKPRWRYFCRACLDIPKDAAPDSDEARAAAVMLELERTDTTT
jgi:hypothetical protein